MKFRLIFPIIIALISFEVFLRLFGICSTQFEKTTGKYQSYYGRALPTHYPTLVPNDTLVTSGEFSYSVISNSDGLREKEFDSVKTGRKKKIMVLGDSFAEGIGAGSDSTWPKLLENKLNQQADSFEVINCGIASSDPVFESRIYRDKLYTLTPSLLIMSVNFSDIHDLITRGGEERFKADGKTRYRNAPWFEPLYQYSYFVRLIMHFVLHYDFSLLAPEQYQFESDAAVQEIKKTIIALNSFCLAHNTKLLVVVHPYLDPYDPFLQKQSKIRTLAAELGKNQIVCYDLFPEMLSRTGKSNYKIYSWPIDKHFTPKGYDLFADLLYSKIEKDGKQLLSNE